MWDLSASGRGSAPTILVARSSPLDPHGRRPRGGHFGPPLKPPPGGSPLRARCAPGFAPSRGGPGDAAGRRRRARADRCSVPGRDDRHPPAGAAVRLARGRRGTGRLRPGAGEAARLGPRGVRLIRVEGGGVAPVARGRCARASTGTIVTPQCRGPRPAGGALFLPRLGHQPFDHDLAAFGSLDGADPLPGPLGRRRAGFARVGACNGATCGSASPAELVLPGTPDAALRLEPGEALRGGLLLVAVPPRRPIVASAGGALVAVAGRRRRKASSRSRRSGGCGFWANRRGAIGSRTGLSKSTPASSASFVPSWSFRTLVFTSSTRPGSGSLGWKGRRRGG